MMPEIPLEELAAVLDSVATDALAKAEIGEPPIDTMAIAKRLGLTIAWDDRQAGRARTVKLSGAGGVEIPRELGADPRPLLHVSAEGLFLR